MEANFQNRTSRTWISIAAFQRPEVGRNPPTSGSWILSSKFQLLRVGSRELEIQLPTANLRNLVSNFRSSNCEAPRLCDKNYPGRSSETTTKPVANKPSRRRGPPRVLAGFYGRLFQPVSRLGNYRFSLFLDTFLRGKSIGAGGPK